MGAQYQGSQDLQVKTVFYGGTATLKEGEALAYDLDDTNAPVDGSGHAQRGNRVVDPATAVLGAFAGLVAESSAGKTGPCFVDIYVPRRGDVCIGYTNVNCTKGSSALGITNAGGRTLVSHTDATLNLDLVAVALQTVDRSSTAGTVLLKFL